MNLSARLMQRSLASGKGLLVDYTTRISARKHLLFKRVEHIMVKGKKNPIQVYTPSYRTSSLYENYSRRMVPADVVASGNYTQSMSSTSSIQSLPQLTTRSSGIHS